MVSTAVHAELGSKRNRATEPEDVVQQVQSEWQEREHAPFLLERCWDQEEQCQHGESGAEHGVVVDVRVGAHGDRVTDQSHDEERHEELETPEGESCDLGHCDGGKVVVVVVFLERRSLAMSVLGRDVWCQIRYLTRGQQSAM